MNNKQADQIAGLLNRQNQLTRQYTKNNVLKSATKFLIETNESNDVIATVEVELVQWYQAENQAPFC